MALTTSYNFGVSLQTAGTSRNCQSEGEGDRYSTATRWRGKAMAKHRVQPEQGAAYWFKLYGKLVQDPGNLGQSFAPLLPLANCGYEIV